jgi:SAM-dependent methyltransferase
MNPAALQDRHRTEEQFHDAKALQGVDDFYRFGALQEAEDHLWQILGDIKGKRVLEIGCGDGTATIRFAKAGAIVTSLDISGEMVELTKRVARDNGVEQQVTALHVGGEDIDFPDCTFDIVYGHSVLHHLNLEIAIPKIVSTLKWGGIATFLEPLDHNPLLSLFRLLTPHRRTPTERPLRLSRVELISTRFSHFEHKEFYLFSLIAFIWYYGLKSKSLFQRTMKALSPLDRTIFKTLPFMRRLAWVVVLRYTR